MNKIISINDVKSERELKHIEDYAFNYSDPDLEEIPCPCGCGKSVLLDLEEFDREFYLNESD